VIDILGASGFEFTIVDTEHGAFGFETAQGLVRACDAAGLVAIVRIPANQDHMITKALDMGAAAVLIPKISSADEAQRAVRASRYGPEGTRGACPCIRAGGHRVRDWRGFAKSAAAQGVIALIETPEGVEDIEAIVAVSGLLAVLAGPFDLSVTLGLDGDTTHPQVRKALVRVAQAASKNKVPLIMPIFQAGAADTRAELDGWLRSGVRLFTVGTDKLLFADHCQRYLETLRSE
jgi:4-hydroxy-2-oxoheptanedioate aldolase